MFIGDAPGAAKKVIEIGNEKLYEVTVKWNGRPEPKRYELFAETSDQAYAKAHDAMKDRAVYGTITNVKLANQF